MKCSRDRPLTTIELPLSPASAEPRATQLRSRRPNAGYRWISLPPWPRSPRPCRSAAAVHGAIARCFLTAFDTVPTGTSKHRFHRKEHNSGGTPENEQQLNTGLAAFAAEAASAHSCSRFSLSLTVAQKLKQLPSPRGSTAPQIVSSI